MNSISISSMRFSKFYSKGKESILCLFMLFKNIIKLCGILLRTKGHISTTSQRQKKKTESFKNCEPHCVKHPYQKEEKATVAGWLY